MTSEYAKQLTDRYNREAIAYRELWAPILRIGALPLLNALAAPGVARILDAGCGVGTLLPDLAARFPAARIFGIDRSPGMLALAPQGFAPAVMDATQLAIRPQSVDLALFIFMLFHLDEPVDALREARRVLRPGGQVGTVTWGGDIESKATRTWAECLDRHGAISPDPTAKNRHAPVNTPEKISALLSLAGFASARSWMEEMVAVMDAEHLLRLKTSMGSEKPLFDSLNPDAQLACIAEARRRMESLTADDFVARCNVVYGMASVD